MSTSVTFNGTTYSIPASGETGWSSLTSFLIDVANNAQTLAAQKGAIRIATSSPITVSSTDYTVLSNLTVAGAVAVTLPVGVDKTIYVIGDTKGDAQTNNITITPNSGTINGASTYVIKNNYGVVALQYSTAASEWKVIGRYFTKIDAANETYGILSPANGGTGVANNAAATLTRSGNHGLTLTTTGTTNLTLPTSGTVATLSNTLGDFAATTSSQLAGVISDETGTGALVFANTPTLVTPVLGVASATSINKIAITAPATGATLTIADGKTATISNTLTFTGTDASSVAFGAGGTVAYTSNKLSVFSATTSSELAGVISDETGSGALVFGTSPTLTTPSITTALILSAAGETRYYNAGGTFYVGFKGGNAAANKIWTLPLADGSANQVLQTDGTGTLSWTSVTSSSLNQYNVSVGNASNTATSTDTSLVGDIKASIVSATVTMTIATPCVVSYTSHGLLTGDKVYLTTTGALPTGLTASTAYFVVKVDADSFNLATSLSNALLGTKIATSGSQSGTHTIYTGGFKSTNPLMTNWTSYTPTFGAGFGSVTGISAFWRRVGDSIDITIVATAGTCTAGASTVSLPSGITIDTAKLKNASAANESTLVGTYVQNGNTNVIFALVNNNTSSNVIGFGYAAGSAEMRFTAANNWQGDNALFSIHCTGIPITEWAI